MIHPPHCSDSPELPPGNKQESQGKTPEWHITKEKEERQVKYYMDI